MPNRIKENYHIFFNSFFLFLAYTLGRQALGINQSLIHLFFLTLVILHTPLLKNMGDTIVRSSTKSMLTLNANPLLVLLSATMFVLLYYVRTPSWIIVPRFDQSVVIFVLFMIISIIMRLGFKHSVTAAIFMLIISSTSQIYSLPFIGITTSSLSYLLIGFGIIQYFYENWKQNQ